MNNRKYLVEATFGHLVTGHGMDMFKTITGFPVLGYVHQERGIFGPPDIGAMIMIDMDGAKVIGV
jgi:hypothetical protein